MSNKTIYLDNAATEKPSEKAIEAAVMASRIYGNPSSTHPAGRAAAEILTRSRETLSKAVGCDHDEFFFMPSGTFANNTAILGIAYRHARRTKRIVSTDSEHPSVENTLRKLESEDFEVIRIKTKGGELDLDALINALKEPTSLVTVMHVNNETGAVYDIEGVRRVIDNSPGGTFLHCDNVQGFLKEKNIACFCDLMSVSAHKIGGLKGCGGLFMRKTVQITPIIEGGGQERTMNPGTEALPAIAAFAAAVLERENDKTQHERIETLRKYLIERLTSIEGVTLNLPKTPASSILSLSMNGVRSEVLTNYLSSLGICVSAGSACSQRRRENRVLTAFGLSRAVADGTIRISISQNNNEADIDCLCAELKNFIAKYKIRPAGR